MRHLARLLVVSPLSVWIVLSSVVHAQVTSESDGPDPHAYPGDTNEALAAEPDESLIGYTPDEGFRMRSKDGDFMLRIALQMAIKLEPSWTEGDRQMNGMFPFLRPILRGNLLRPWFMYRFSLEAGRADPFVLDAYFDIEPREEIGVRVGQQATVVSRHENFGPQQIFFPEFAGVANYFWSGRERGVTLYGTVLDERLDYYGGIYGGSPIDVPVNLEDNYVLEARLTANPLGPVNANELPFTAEGTPLPLRVSFTAQGFYGRLQTVDESYNTSSSVLTPNAALTTSKLGMLGGDVWFQTGPAIVFGEFYWRQQRLIGADDWYGSLGAWGQVIVNVYRNVIGAGVRFNWIDPNTELSDDNAFEVEGQVAWFVHPPELTVKARYAWLKQQSPDAAELDDFELPYVEGTTHVATLQAIMAF